VVALPGRLPSPYSEGAGPIASLRLPLDRLRLDGWTGGLLRGTGYRRSVQCIFYGGAINVNRYNILAVGASVGYNFGPAQLTVWALDEVSASASGGTPQLFPGPTITKGFTAFAQLSYRLWAPDEPMAAAKSSLYHK
jgi:hypothetical protein